MTEEFSLIFKNDFFSCFRNGHCPLDSHGRFHHHRAPRRYSVSHQVKPYTSFQNDLIQVILVGFMFGKKSIECHQIDYFLDFRIHKMKPKDDETPAVNEDTELATAQPKTLEQSVRLLLTPNQAHGDAKKY